MDWISYRELNDLDRDLRDATTPDAVRDVLEDHAPCLSVEPTFAHRVRCQLRDAAVAEAEAANSTKDQEGPFMPERYVARTNLKGNGTIITKGEEFDPRQLGLGKEALEHHLAKGTIAHVPKITTARLKESQRSAGFRPTAGVYTPDGTPAQGTEHRVAGMEQEAGQTGEDDGDTAA